jgi:hypothetical protein
MTSNESKKYESNDSNHDESSCEECQYLYDLVKKHKMKQEESKKCYLCGKKFRHRKEKLKHVYQIHYPML